MFEVNGERLLKRGAPTMAVLTIAGFEAFSSLFGGGGSRANADSPIGAGSVAIESTINGVVASNPDAQDATVICSGFDARVARLAQGEGFSTLLGQVSREMGVTDEAIVEAIEHVNGIGDGEMAQPDVDYKIPEACTIDG